MQTFDLELLRTFLAIADHGTFERAGIALGRTQAAVTLQMQRLEQQVGVALFVRQGRSKQISEAGRQLQRYAREMLRLNDEAVHALRDPVMAGSLRIGSPHDVADTRLPPILSRIARFAPNLRLEINVGRSPFLMESLHRGEIDMTISTREDSRLEGFPLLTSPTLWICSTQFMHVPGQPLQLILIEAPSIFRRIAVEALERRNIAWRQAYQATNLIGVKAAVMAGLGISPRNAEFLGPDMRVLAERDGLPRLPDVTYFLWKRPQNVNPVVDQVFELLRSRPGRMR